MRVSLAIGIRCPWRFRPPSAHCAPHSSSQAPSSVRSVQTLCVALSSSGLFPLDVCFLLAPWTSALNAGLVLSVISGGKPGRLDGSALRCGDRCGLGAGPARRPDPSRGLGSGPQASLTESPSQRGQGLGGGTVSAMTAPPREGTAGSCRGSSPSGRSGSPGERPDGPTPAPGWFVLFLELNRSSEELGSSLNSSRSFGC